jgi:hypothetical protein
MKAARTTASLQRGNIGRLLGSDVVLDLFGPRPRLRCLGINAVAAQNVEKSMPSITHRRVAAVAIVSTLALITLSADAFAKSSRSRATAAAATVAVQGSGASSYSHPSGRAIPPYPTGLTSRGNVIDNTAGWGDVGAR